MCVYIFIYIYIYIYIYIIAKIDMQISLDAANRVISDTTPPALGYKDFPLTMKTLQVITKQVVAKLKIRNPKMDF